jgi:hypothetical protein
MPDAAFSATNVREAVAAEWIGPDPDAKPLVPPPDPRFVAAAFKALLAAADAARQAVEQGRWVFVEDRPTGEGGREIRIVVRPPAAT